MHHIDLSSKDHEKKKIVWLTDLHIDAVHKDKLRQFFQLVVEEKPDYLLIGGDISNGVNSLWHLRKVGQLISCPFYFVLGNHDFYYGSIEEMRKKTHKACESMDQGYYLTDLGVIHLTEEVGLVGHDGWVDGRAGDFMGSHIVLNDYLCIQELKGLTNIELLKVLQKYAEKAADYLKRVLTAACKQYKKIIVLTHIPPFEDVCYYKDGSSNPHYSAHFVSKITGDALLDVAKSHLDIKITVLCGHTHTEAFSKITSNLDCYVGGADLGQPKLQGVLTL